MFCADHIEAFARSRGTHGLKLVSQRDNWKRYNRALHIRQELTGNLGQDSGYLRVDTLYAVVKALRGSIFQTASRFQKPDQTRWKTYLPR